MRKTIKEMDSAVPANAASGGGIDGIGGGGWKGEPGFKRPRKLRDILRRIPRPKGERKP